MFIRTKTTPNSPRRSVQIVESIRFDNKVKQRIVRHVGVAMDERELGRLIDLAEYIKAKLETEQSQQCLFSPEEMAELAIEYRKRNSGKENPLNVNLRELREEQRSVVGFHEVYGALYQQLGFNQVLRERQAYAKKLLREVCLARIANPTSKREAVNMLEREFGVTLSLSAVYRMMDKLDDKAIERIQQVALYAARGILQDKVDVLFYDCTTLYFESFTEDELKQNGYSKDNKFNQAQILLALLVTQEGLPFGYEVFSGATFEGHTLTRILGKLKERFEIYRVVFVADRGLLSEDNLSLLEAHGFSYIVGAKLRVLSKIRQAEILEKQLNTQNTKERFAIFKMGQRRLVVTYNEERAKKDKHDREKAVAKIMKRLQKSKNPKSLLNNYGYKKYLELKGQSSLQVNTEKIEEEVKWDGLAGVITNQPDWDGATLFQHYRGLWQIEACFRVSKHDLKIRPIYHWTPNRIKAHVAIAFMALTCVRHLEYRVALQYQSMSTEVIRKELRQVQVSFLKHITTRERYCIPSKISQDVRKIYHLMDIKHSTVPFKLS